MKRLIPIIVILTGLGLYTYFYHIRPGRMVDPTVRGSGTIEATEVVISPKLAARILTIQVKEGDRVRTGDVLVTLDCIDIEARVAQAEAQVAQAEAGLASAKAAVAQAQAANAQSRAAVAPVRVSKEHAEKQLKRASDLYSKETVSQSVIDDAESQQKASTEQVVVAEQGVKVSDRMVEVAGRAVDASKAQVALAQKGLEVARVQLQECTIKAPLDGVVMSRNYEPGEMALPGASILKLGHLDEVYTWTYVPNEEVGRIRLGQKVRIAADTYPGREFSGTVVHINEKAEFTPKSIQTKEDRTRLVFGVKVEIPNPDTALLVGMPVEAAFVEQQRPGQR